MSVPFHDPISDGDVMDHAAEIVPGLTVADVLEAVDLAGALATWLSGSVVEGLCTPNSDVDLFVAVETLPTGIAYTRSEEGRAIAIRFAARRRLDFEFWTTGEIEVLARKLARMPLDDPGTNLLNRLAEHETEFIHRIGTGRVLCGPAAFRRLRSRFDPARLARYMAENQTYYVDDAFEDTVGMLHGGNLRAAALRARATVGYAVEALLCAHGDTSGSAKHRLARIARLAARRPNLREVEATYWQLESTIPGDPAGQAKYVESALRFSESIMNCSQATLRLSVTP